MPKTSVILFCIGMLFVGGDASCQLQPLSESEFSEFLNLQNAHPHLSTPVHNSSFIIHNSNTPCYSTIHHNNQLSKNVSYSRQNQKTEQQYRTHFLHNAHSYSGRTSPNSPLGEMSAGQRGGGSEGGSAGHTHTTPTPVHNS